MIKKNISFEILKMIDNNENNDNNKINIENNENILLNFDINMDDYLIKKYNNNYDDKDEVESLCANTEDNCDSDIDLENLDNFLTNQKNISDKMQSKINKENGKNRYLDFILAVNESDNKKIENVFEENNATQNMYSKINELEIENQILKNEVNELKEKMQMFEIFMLNFQTSSCSSFSSNNHGINDFSQIDKLKTIIKETQYEMKKMKDQFEYIEALETENRDKIEVIETLMENIKD